jgi:hypothetical protein
MAESPKDQWIIVRNWDRFQHYTHRNPTWIKVYTELAHKDEFISLTLPQKGMLLTIWIEYAASRGRVSIEMIRRRVGVSYRNATVEALNHAGFITLSASKPLAQSKKKIYNQGLSIPRGESKGPDLESVKDQTPRPSNGYWESKPTPEERHQIAEQIRASLRSMGSS